MNQTKPEKLFYIDEAGIEEYIYRKYGKAPRGEKIHAKISGKRYVRTSIISALNHKNKVYIPIVV